MRKEREEGRGRRDVSPDAYPYLLLVHPCSVSSPGALPGVRCFLARPVRCGLALLGRPCPKPSPYA
jgi:hypothetical protein